MRWRDESFCNKQVTNSPWMSRQHVYGLPQSVGFLSQVCAVFCFFSFGENFNSAELLNISEHWFAAATRPLFWVGNLNNAATVWKEHKRRRRRKKKELFRVLMISWWKHGNTTSAVLSGGDLYQSTQTSNESRGEDTHRLWRLQSILLGGGADEGENHRHLGSVCATWYVCYQANWF